MSISQNPDLILYNANIITIDPVNQRVHQVAISNGRISSIGNHKGQLHSGNGKTEAIDCRGKTILPGFIDAHMHLTAFAKSLVSLNLGPQNGIRSIADIQSIIQKASQKQLPGSWIKGKGYQEFYLEEKRHPTRWDLDLASTVHPIKLTHQSGHAHVLNSLALDLTCISKETPDPDGGLIERDLKTGEPTGVLYGMSEFLSQAIPHIDSLQRDGSVEMASHELLSYGITSIQDTSYYNDVSCWKQFQCWETHGYFRPRVTMTLGADAFKRYRKEDYFPGVNKNHLSLSGVKVMVDEVAGRLHPPQDELNELVYAIHRSGFQAIIHAVEEPAIDAACSAIEDALRRVPRQDHRHRVEHSSVCPPYLAKRLASQGAMVVTQPPFIYYHGDRYRDTVPPVQFRYLYPLATLIKNHVHLAGSSDSPVVPPNPLVGIYAAVTRMSETGSLVQAQEKIGVLEALRLYTISAARAAFKEDVVGSISPGKLADLIALNADPTQVPIEEIKNIQVEMTILDGQVVWDKAELTNNPSLNVR